MKHLKTFEQHSNESHNSTLSAEEQVEILNSYIDNSHKITKYEDSPQGLIIKQSVILQGVIMNSSTIDFESLSELNLNLYKVEGDFVLSRTRMSQNVLKGQKLKDLKGFPEIVTGKLDISSNSLVTLEGCPKVVGEKMICSFNYELTSVKGICQDVKMLLLNMCKSLTSLESIGKVDTLYLLDTPVSDLSPLAGPHSVEVWVTDDKDKYKLKAVPENVTVNTVEEYNKQKQQEEISPEKMAALRKYMNRTPFNKK